MKTLLPLMILMPLTLGCNSNNGGDSKLQGTWKYTRIVTDGKEVPADLLRGAPTVTFEGNKMIRKEGEKVVDNWTYQLDATKNPKQITITMGEPGEERSNYHTYKIEGDTLTMCSSNAKFSREFSTNLVPGAHFFVMTRVK